MQFFPAVHEKEKNAGTKGKKHHSGAHCQAEECRYTRATVILVPGKQVGGNGYQKFQDASPKEMAALAEDGRLGLHVATEDVKKNRPK